MKKHSVVPAFILIVALLLSLVPYGANAAAESPREGEKEATLMVYMTGSDLESSCAAATKDLEEMAQSGVDLEKANVVVFTGGSVKWHSDVPDDANAVLVLTADGFRTVETFPQLSMGTSENLTRFLDYAYRNYPARQYDLILWDHGNGPLIGYCVDRQFGNDTLTLPEMREALAASPFSSENKLGFIGFDACLMASAELVDVVSDYAEYLIASQETEPSFGWDYAFLDGLGTHSARELACSAAERYLAFSEAYYAEKQFFHSDVTLSVVDLQYGAALKEALCALFKKAAPDVLNRFSRIAVSRVNTRSFGRASTGSEYDLVDLRCLAEELSAYYPEETRQLIGLLDRMVVVSVSNTEQSCGLSLYYPFYNKTYYHSSWKDAYREMNAFPDYLNFLNRYEQAWLASDLQDLFDSTLCIEQRADGTYFLPLSPEQLDATAEGTLYVLRRIGESTFAQVYCDLSVEKTDGGVCAAFGGDVIYFETRTGFTGIPPMRLMDRVGSKRDYLLVFLLRNNNLSVNDPAYYKMCRLILSADPSDGSTEVKGIYYADGESGGKREEVDLSEWTHMFFVELPVRYLTRAENGRILPIDEWPVNDSFHGQMASLADDVRFVLKPLYDDGYEYCLMFELTDVQGDRICSEPFPLTLGSAPAAPEPEPTEPVYDADGTARLSLCGLDVGILPYRTLQGDPLYVVRVVNENEFTAELSLRNVSADRVCSEDNTFISAGPGETVYYPFLALNELIRRSGKTDDLRFTATVENTEINETLCRNMPIALRGVTPDAAVCLPVLGARAEEQVLTPGNGITARLYDLGFFPDGYDVDPNGEGAEAVAHLLIENTSDEERLVCVPGFCLNGVDLMTYAQSVTLSPHESYYLRLSCSVQEAARLCPRHVFYDADQEAIEPERYCSVLTDTLSSVSVLFLIDGKGARCPVALSDAGPGENTEPQGVPILEDETWRVLREVPAPDAHPDAAMLWIENRSDETLRYYILAGETSLFTAEALPGSVQRVPLYVPEAVQGETELVIRSYDWMEAYRYAESFGRTERTPRETAPFRLLSGKEASEQ